MSKYADVKLASSPGSWWRLGGLPDGFVNEYDAAVLARADTVAAYKPSDVTGTTAVNAATPGVLDGTVGGSPAVNRLGALLGLANGGDAFDFTADTNKAVSVAANSVINPAAGFSMIAVFCLDTVTGLQAIAGDLNSAGNQGARLAMNGSSLEFRLGDGATNNLSVATGLAAGRYYMAVGTFDGTDARLYVDSVLSDTDPRAFVENTATTFRLGLGGASTQPLDGGLARVSCHNAAISAEDIADLFVKIRPVIDAMGNANAGMIGTLTPAPGLVASDTDTAFTGWSTTNHIQRPYDPAQNPATPAVGAMIKYSGATGLKHVIKTTRKASTAGYELSITTAGYAQFATYDGSERAVTGATDLRDGKPHKITASWDGTTRRLFVDGVEVASSTTGGYTQNTTAPMRVGIGHDGTLPFAATGIIDEVWFDDAPITAADEYRQYVATLLDSAAWYTERSIPNITPPAVRIRL